jgi:hypothetical protein
MGEIIKGVPGGPVIGPKAGLDQDQILRKEKEVLDGSGGRSANIYKKVLETLRGKAAKGNRIALENLREVEKRLGL